MKRLGIVIIALIVGAAAPARAWCEASCLATAHHGDAPATPHCPAHKPTTGTAVTAAVSGDCPVVESARPIPARLDLQCLAVETLTQLSTPAPLHSRAVAPSRSRLRAPSHPIPLRI